ncbi:putative reverse transcriptase domain-containing protein, partial [Tanacetum coccineum]
MDELITQFRQMSEDAEDRARDSQEKAYKEFRAFMQESFRGDRVKFASRTLLDSALTWWNVYVRLVTLDTAHATPWNNFKAMFIRKYCPRNEVKQMENELWNLKVKVGLHEAVEMAQGLMYQLVHELGENFGDKQKWNENHYNHNNTNHTSNLNPNKRPEAVRVFTAGQGSYAGKLPYCGKVYNLRVEAAVEDNNVVNGMFLINNVYDSVLFDTGEDRSFVSYAFSKHIDIPPTTLDTNYSVELADGKSLTTNTILRGCTLNLQNHLFKIDLLPIELGSFDVIVRIDWMVEHHTEVVCYEKYIRVPYGNDMLIIQGERSGVKNESRLEKEETEASIKRIEGVPVVRDFPEVFPEELPGLPPTRQVEFHIELIPGATPVTHAPYCLAHAEMKELAEQLKELSDK